MAQDYEGWLKERLTKKRLAHSLAVRERANELARIHGVNAEKAALAGLLHDCCHCLPSEEQLKIINAHDILLDSYTMAHTNLWHALAGSLVIQDELEITDTEVISAVRWHTTGVKDMTRLEQVVYLADLTSADRDYSGVKEDRRLSEKSMSLCMFKSLAHTIEELVEDNEPIVRDAWEAYNYFWELAEKEKTE